MYAKSAKLQNKQYNTHQVLNCQYPSTEIRIPRPQNYKKMMYYRCFYHFYDSIFPFLPVFGQIFQMDPRNTLILAGKNGTQFFSITECQRIT